MREIHVTHPEKTFARCKKCQKEPKHFRVLGRQKNDEITVVCLTAPLERHFLECCPCRLRTELRGSLSAASLEWARMYGLPELGSQVLKLRRQDHA